MDAPHRSGLRAARLTLVAAWAAASAVACAQAGPDAERALRAGGYTLAHSDADGHKAWQYWWSRRQHDCVMLALLDGRLEHRESTSETDCNQTRDDPRMSERGKVALAAARLLRVDALAHKSHERDVRRYNDVQEVAQFERGYRDGLEGRRTEQHDGRNAYRDGFRAGQRKAQSPGRPTPPGVTPPAAVGRPSDLAGRSARELEPTMQSLGYQKHGGFNAGRDAFTTWRGRPGECVRVAVRDGRIQTVNDISESECN